ncbi:MAG TPA: ABC transporter ATP-binding protein [Chthonomonadaceae bacterium]|nr:ABC transporter ATP-binding protein [Chthonomonadaceae bacterium]
MAVPLLQVEDLRTYFSTPHGIARAVDGVSFTLDKGETMALVGESGCGKSMTALSLLQLVPEPAGYIESGRVLFNGVDLLDYTWSQMREIRGRDIAMIFQEPMTSLNPTFTIGTQMIEAMVVHGAPNNGATRRRAEDLLARVGLSDPHQALRQYPHELSGGMRQRVMIAMALANNPQLLIADEPTTALDVTIQAQILELIGELQRETGMAVLLITHDLGIVAKVANHVAVMYAGQIVESAPTRELFGNPQHPYTKGLFASLPSRAQRGRDLLSLQGTVPQATNWPPACRFEPRCPFRWQTCAQIAPRYLTTGPERAVRCHLYDPAIADRPNHDAVPLATAERLSARASEPEAAS